MGSGLVGLYMKDGLGGEVVADVADVAAVSRNKPAMGGAAPPGSAVPQGQSIRIQQMRDMVMQQDWSRASRDMLNRGRGYRVGSNFAHSSAAAPCSRSAAWAHVRDLKDLSTPWPPALQQAVVGCARGPRLHGPSINGLLGLVV